MKLSNKAYDIMKYILLIVVPAVITLIIGLGKLYGFETELIVGTIALVSTFLGSCLKISTDNYNKGE